MRHETAIFGQKEPNTGIPVIIFLGSFLLCQQQKHKNLQKPLFLECFSKPKKDNLQKMNLRQRNLKNPIFAPFFFRKRLVLENCQIIGHQNNHNMITVCAKNRLKPLFLSATNNLAQIITPTWPRS